MPAVGLSVESDAVRLISFEDLHGKKILKAADEIKLEPGIVVAGDVAQPEKLLKVLMNVRNEHGVKFARVSLPEEKSYVYEAVIPLPEEGEIRDAVEFSLDQNVPISAGEAVFDFAVVEAPFVNNGVQSVRVIVSVYPRDVAENWLDLFKQAGIMPLSFILESQGAARSLVADGDMRTALVVHFMKEKTVIAIVSGSYVRFSTTVANNLESAEHILKSHEGERIEESVELLAVRDEVKKVYTYWMSKDRPKSKKDVNSVKSLIVSGHVADMSDISEYLGTHVGVPASLGNVWQNAFSLDDVVPEIEFEDSLRFAAAAGAALPR